MPKRSAHPHRAAAGFTLLELAGVVTAMSLLSLLALPQLSSFLARTKSTEATTNLEVIAHAERTYWRDHGRFLACGPTPALPPRGGATPFGGEDLAACWEDLGVELLGGVRFAYQVTLEDGDFTVHARGDLDADGEMSHYVLHGRSLALSIERPLE